MWEPPTPSEGLRCATITYTYDNSVFPTSLDWRALEGIADDNYTIYVDGTLVYTYTDSPPINDPEVWNTNNQDLTSYGLSCQTTHTVQFCATGPAWASFSTYGQVAIDWVTITSGTCPVGGTVYPINKAGVLTPWIGLILILPLAIGAHRILRRHRVKADDKEL